MKASERAGIRLLSPAENRIKWRYFGANYLRPRRVSDWMEVGPTTGTVNEKWRTLRKTRNWVRIRTPKQSHNAIRDTTDPVSPAG